MGEPSLQRKVMICIPSYTGSLNVNTVNSIANASIEVAPLGWQTVLVTRSGDSILPRCRDVLVSQFYWSDCSDMLFWDADISCEPGAFTRLMSHPVEMVGGVYRGRGDPPQWPLCSLYPGELGGINVQHPAGIGEVRGLGTGFLRITRAAIDRLLRHVPENHWYEDHLTAKGMKILHFFNFLFDFNQDPGMRLRSEDYAFCDLFRAAGGKVYADVQLTLHHSGSHIWTGNFQEHLNTGVAAGTMRIEGGQAPTMNTAPRVVTLVDAVEGMIAE
jgi:hypothetical protein